MRRMRDELVVFSFHAPPLFEAIEVAPIFPLVGGITLTLSQWVIESSSTDSRLRLFTACVVWQVELHSVRRRALHLDH